ncbi:MAG: glycosyltransferase family 4 protein [Burkholderiales bacterium]|nr:glycosyltransferase family 4 protein [Burkholderiales bacterium]
MIATFMTCLVIVLTQKWHGRLSFDHDLNGVQKIHDTPVPRIGGVGVVVGLILAGLFSYHIGGETYDTAAKLLLCGVPAFAAGLIEDFTKKVGVRPRLFASFISAALAYWLLGAKLTNLDTPGLNFLMQFSLVSFFFTCFAVGGLTNAINIIDGLNGLASGSVAIMLGGLAAIAWAQGDILVVKLCLWGMAAAVGFLVVNYPFGRIFLGDGGAYLAGFWLAECAVMLLQRNPHVSTWAVLLAVIYPAWETVFSMYRRQFKHKTQTGAPDSAHLHHVLLELTEKGHHRTSYGWRNHAIVSAFIWLCVLAAQFGAKLATNSVILGMLTIALFAGGYVMLYQAARSRSEFEDRGDDGTLAVTSRRMY